MIVIDGGIAATIDSTVLIAGIEVIAVIALTDSIDLIAAMIVLISEDLAESAQRFLAAVDSKDPAAAVTVVESMAVVAPAAKVEAETAVNTAGHEDKKCPNRKSQVS